MENFLVKSATVSDETRPHSPFTLQIKVLPLPALVMLLLQVLAEMVNLHFLSLMEALLECRSTILAKLMPLWCPVLHAYNITVHNI